jgi:D-galacturonate reductase
LVDLAEKNGVLCTVEHHKRQCEVLLEIFLREWIPDLPIGFDPAYADAKGKARLLGDFNFFSSWMSQPKTQLETFKVRRMSDCSFCLALNPHHVLLGVGWKG